MKAIKIIGVLTIALIVMMSCTTAQFSGFQMNKSTPPFSVVGELEETVNVTEFLGSPGGANLLNISADAMDGPVYDAIQKAIQKSGGDAAVDITIRQEATLFNMLATGLTGGIWAPCTVHISGKIVKYN